MSSDHQRQTSPELISHQNFLRKRELMCQKVLNGVLSKKQNRSRTSFAPRRQSIASTNRRPRSQTSNSCHLKLTSRDDFGSTLIVQQDITSTDKKFRKSNFRVQKPFEYRRSRLSEDLLNIKSRNKSLSHQDLHKESQESLSDLIEDESQPLCSAPNFIKGHLSHRFMTNKQSYEQQEGSEIVWHFNRSMSCYDINSSNINTTFNQLICIRNVKTWKPY